MVIWGNPCASCGSTFLCRGPAHQVPCSTGEHLGTNGPISCLRVEVAGESGWAWAHSARGMVHIRPASTTSGQARAFPTHAPIPGFARNAELVALCSQSRFLTGSAGRESSDEPENQPDLGLLCLCSYGVRMIGHTLGALITGVLPQVQRFYWARS